MFGRVRGYKLTLFGRSLLMVSLEVFANVLLWVLSGIIFGRHEETRSIIGLALLAWTLGLRHALDADHISAIDNATRGLISMGQLPVTCGLFFSLGHSTIVIVVNIAIAISSDVYNRLEGVGTVGGIVGAAVSGVFLFIVGLANSIILWRIIKRRRLEKRRQAHALATGEDRDSGDFIDDNPKHYQFLAMRIIGRVITAVDRPWKMYPVSVLFGFGFDTASSIALLAVSALAKRCSDGSPIPSSHIVILPLLFTAGMTLIDSLDSILMLYSYSGFPDRGFAILRKRKPERTSPPTTRIPEDATSWDESEESTAPIHVTGGAQAEGVEDHSRVPSRSSALVRAKVFEEDEEDFARNLRVKVNMMSGLSIVLTLLSILVAFSISLITVMGLIGENCGPCTEAAEAEDGGGLAGSWWRAWARANDNSGYIGAAIVGAFLVIVLGWYGGRWVLRKVREKIRTHEHAQ